MAQDLVQVAQDLVQVTLEQKIDGMMEKLATSGAALFVEK